MVSQVKHLFAAMMVIVFGIGSNEARARYSPVTNLVAHYDLLVGESLFPPVSVNSLFIDHVPAGEDGDVAISTSAIWEVDWGDGASDSVSSTMHEIFFHSYSAVGVYDVSVLFTGKEEYWYCGGGGCPADLADLAGSAIVKSSYASVVSVTGAIPEPETYAMLLAGLGLLGWHARRRKLKQAA